MANRIKAWLMKAPIQLEKGPHIGGIAGWLDDQNRMDFVYGEITGYYLTFLAWLSRSTRSDLAIQKKMNAALHWFGNFNGNRRAPLTRHYLKPGAGDWRNRLCFSFDLAMMLRGVSMVPREGNQDRAAELRTAIIRKLEAFVDENGRLLPVLPVEGNSPDTPERWSTMPGPWQVKAAAAILSSDMEGRSARLHSAAINTVNYWRGRHAPVENLHSYLYSMEGLMMFGLLYHDPTVWDETGRMFEHLMAFQRKDGGLPVSFTDTDAADRSDVVAQALRIGCILKALGRLANTIHISRLALLSRNLARFVSPEGSVCFYPQTVKEGIYRNVWSAMFSFQAFLFYNGLEEGTATPEEWIRYLV